MSSPRKERKKPAPLDQRKPGVDGKRQGKKGGEGGQSVGEEPAGGSNGMSSIWLAFFTIVRAVVRAADGVTVANCRLEG